jgi:hypothetical protein
MTSSHVLFSLLDPWEHVGDPVGYGVADAGGQRLVALAFLADGLGGNCLPHVPLVAADARPGDLLRVEADSAGAGQRDGQRVALERFDSGLASPSWP